METMGLEPTTPCLQSMIQRLSHLGRSDKSAGQGLFSSTAMIRQLPPLPTAMGT